MTITDSTISGNTASDFGGGIFLNGFYLRNPYSAYPLQLSNSTVTANVSTGSHGGGGIVDLHVPLFGVSDFESSIVAANTNTIRRRPTMPILRRRRPISPARTI